MSPFGRIAYEAYADKRGWKTFLGDNMYRWHDLDHGLQEAWEAAAQAVLRPLAPEVPSSSEG